jgi:hypothetical protein
MNNTKCLWGAAINLYGLWSKAPIAFSYFQVQKVWYDPSLDLEIRKTGLDIRRGITTFSSYNKKDVENFIIGALTMHRAMKRLVH